CAVLWFSGLVAKYSAEAAFATKTGRHQGPQRKYLIILCAVLWLSGLVAKYSAEGAPCLPVISRNNAMQIQ
ncbi:MAG: hypothetical protein ACOYXB_00270, partial [Bacteroidota bacterium]